MEDETAEQKLDTALQNYNDGLLTFDEVVSAFLNYGPAYLATVKQHDAKELGGRR